MSGLRYLRLLAGEIAEYGSIARERVEWSSEGTEE